MHAIDLVSSSRRCTFSIINNFLKHQVKYSIKVDCIADGSPPPPPAPSFCFFEYSIMKITPIVVAAATINHTINNGTANINIKNPLQSGSLANIYVNYGSQALEGKLSLSFGNCQSGESVYDIAQMNISQELHPEKFVWFVPEDAYTMTGCLLAKNASGNVFAKSESYNPSKNRKKRLFGELAHLHFDAVHYHHNDKSNKHNYAISKDASK